MRIHFLVRSLNRDGAGSHQNAISYIRYLKERGHTVTVHAINSVNNPPSDIQLIEHAKEKLGLLANNKFLTKLLFDCEKDADIFLLYGVDFIWGAGRYRMGGGVIPVTIYLDTCLSSMDTGQRLSTVYYIKRVLWEKLFGMRDAKWVDAYIASSLFIKEIYVYHGFIEKKFNIVSNFFEFDAERNVQGRTVSQTVRLLYAGRMTHDKGTDLLIEAVRNINLEIPWILRIVGDGPMKKECEQMIREYGLIERVQITQWVDQSELPEVYKSADIFIHPSRCPEAFGRTFVEAMSYGIPVVASNIGSAPWTIGEGGLLFSSGDVSKLRECICSLIKDKELRERLGKQGVSQSQKFDKRIVGPLLEKTLETLVAL